MRTFVRVVAIMIAIGAVLVTVAGIAGPPVLALLQHPADSSRMPSAASVAGRPYAGSPAAESALVDRESQRIVDARSIAATAAGHHVDQTRPFRVLTAKRATLVLPASATPYRMSALAAAAPESVK